ncbi:D-alanyl-D-alanine carboxypeptidase [Streptomyces sp. NPDC018031]|uniref:D-alanyl-D-alanine carboxypeptidase n=1 Tax=Streptomyces sp. NPDC018031 TaxID=3365033 RepID=UPI0037AFB743
MAGESPDTSEQQKSSGETTRGEQDPRLAVFREAGESREAEDSLDAERPQEAERSEGAESSGDAPEPADGTDGERTAEGAGPDSGGTPADRATAVFRTVRPGRAADRDADPDPGPADDGAAPRAEADEPRPEAEAESDSADAPGDDVRDGESATTGADRDGTADAAAGDAGEHSERPAAGRLPVRPGARSDATAAADGGDGDGEDAERAEARGADDDADDGEGAKASPPGEGGDARLRAAVAAWVSGTSEDSADAEDSGSPEGTGNGSTRGGNAAERPESGSTADRDSSSSSEASPSEASRAADAAPGDDTRTMAFGTLRQKSAEPPADQATAVFGTVRTPGSETGSAAGSPERRAADRATAFFGAVRPKAPADAEAEADAEAPETTGTTGNGAAARRATDQATAFFGAVRQPRTPDPAEDGGEPGSGGDGDPDGTGTPSTDRDGTTDRKREAARDDRADGDRESAADRDGEAAGGGKADAGGANKAEAVKKAETAKKAQAEKTDRGAEKTRRADEDADEAPGRDGKGGTDGKTVGKAAAGRDGGDTGDDKKATDRAGKAAGGTGKRAADQPTTALKALGTPDGSAAEPARPAAGPGGRPSTFVPLRSADDPETGRKPADGNERAGAAAGTSAPAPAADGKPSGGPLPESERTKQQPLPPAGEPAPLDLLAQLTNTPPPPETPVRTAVRRVKIWTPLVLLLLIVFCTVQAMRPLPEPELRSAGQTSFTFEGDAFAMPWPGEGQAAALVEGVGSLGAYGPQKPVPIASVTKVMTAYVVLKGHPLKPDEKGTSIAIDAQAGSESNAQDESRVPVEKGQKYSLRQMLEMTMIPSGNNVARQLARWDAGSEAAFVKKMNATAKELGMTHTTYTDPSGLKSTTRSTAVDQLKLASAVMKIETFRKIVATPDIEIPGVGRIFNNNKLVADPDLVVRGIKTGSSTPAGGALMWATYRTVGEKDRLVLGVTLDQHTSSTDPNAHLQLVLDKSEEQIRAVRGALTAATLVKKGQVVGEVDDGLGGTTPVVATKDLAGAGWPGLKAGFTLTVGPEGLPHSAKAGTVVGHLTVGTGPGKATVPVALQKDLAEPSFGAKLTRIS